MALQGIYKIEHIPTKSVYIGSSCNILKRWEEHFKALMNNKHHSYKLQKVWNNCNMDEFNFQILEIIEDKCILFKREQYWIDNYDASSYKNFNILDEAGKIKPPTRLDNFKVIQKKECGSFIFFNTNTMDELKDILNDNDLVKFFYMSSYIKNKGALMLDDNRTYIDKSRLEGLLKIDIKTFKSYFSKLIENNILIIKDNKLYLNTKYCFKGGIDNNNCTKIYTKQLRSLYLNSNIRQHESLSIIFKLIPFINFNSNILCENVLENDLHCLKILCLSNLCDYIGRNKTKVTRIMKTLQNFSIDNEPIIKRVEPNKNIKKQHIVINPRLFYKGDELESFKYLINMFKSYREN